VLGDEMRQNSTAAAQKATLAQNFYFEAPRLHVPCGKNPAAPTVKPEAEEDWGGKNDFKREP
jgi:hypothetical protein